MIRTIISISLALGGLLAGPAHLQADWGPNEIHVQGALTNLVNEPLEGPVDLTFALYDGPSGAAAVLFTEDHLGVELTGGRFDVLLGTEEDLGTPSVFEENDGIWVGISVDGGLELPRAPLASVGYAMQARHAVMADTLAVGSCQPGEILTVSGDGTAWVCIPDLVLTEAEVEAIIADDGYAMLADLSTVALSGLFGDLLGIPEEILDGDNDLLAGLTCNLGFVLKWNGAWSCAPDLVLSPTEVEEIVADLGFALESELSEVASSGSFEDLSDLPMGFLDGDDDLLGLTVCDDGDVMKSSGGVWACAPDADTVGLTEEVDPQVGDLGADSVPRWDGVALADGSITDTGDAVAIDGVLSMEGNKVTDMAVPAALTDGATKGYVDATIQQIPSSIRIARNYTVVLALNSPEFCPVGWSQEAHDAMKGPDNNLYVNIHERGFFMGGMNSLNYGNKQLYARVPGGHVSTMCYNVFHSSSDRPHLAVEMFKGGGPTSCRAGWHYIPATHLRGNSSTGYIMANSSGAFLGYNNSWSRDSHGHDEQHGYSSRTFTSNVDTVCYKVMGVDEDPDTKNGVFPVFYGVQNETDCPDDWNVATTSSVDGSNDYYYLQISDNATFAGGQGGWTGGGGNYMYVQFAYSHVNFVCWNYLPIVDAQPFWHLRTPHSGACPDGFTSFNATAFKGWNNNGYISATGHGLYVGGLSSWGGHDYGNGWIRHTFSSQVNNKVCIKLENVVQ